MKRRKNTLGVAIFAMLMAFVLLTLSMAPLVTSKGRSDTVTKTADFDFESGCLDDSTTVRDGEAVSVYLSDSAYGTLQMKDFRICDITFYGQASSRPRSSSRSPTGPAVSMELRLMPILRHGSILQ